MQQTIEQTPTVENTQAVQTEPAPKVAMPAAPAAQPTPTPHVGLLEKVVARTIDVTCNDRGSLNPKSLVEITAVANWVYRSGLAPKSLKSPEQVAVCIAFGMELGLSVMQSLRSIAPINNVPSVYGDTMLALAMPVIKSYSEWFEDGQGKIDETQPGWAARMAKAQREKALVAVFEGTRKNGQIVRESFSMADADAAKLTGKAGPWTEYPRRMLQFRARSWGLRALAPDMLCGVSTVEETLDLVEIAPDTRTAQSESISNVLAAKAEAIRAEAS